MPAAPLPIRSNFGFSVLLKYTWTHDQEESGIEPPTFVFDLLYSLSYDQPGLLSEEIG